MASGSSASHSNRLIEEKSPYLLQHASNPVDWYPWGEEAFKAAREQNKLIFLSVGYSTCHWCHVMERESFENDAIAKIMNENFINIKVDREERPDVDKVYMTFVTSLSGGGGWPMSVWLTPDLKPVYGGTYYPPDNRYYGQPGFSTLLNSISKQWKSSPEQFKESGKNIMEVLKKNSKLNLRAATELPNEDSFVKAFSQLKMMYEPEYGGFGDAPKFPQPSNFNFLFAYRALYPHIENTKRGQDMALHTLRKMDMGGIHDHISQGFARYSTDKRWHVPHFEKMLYDQAQLVMAYLDAYLLTKEERYANVVKDIMTYVMRDLSHPKGGFYSAEDADSYPTPSTDKKREGAFCVWTHKEIQALLSDPVKEGSDVIRSKVFSFHYSVAEGGNVDPYQDPHDELKNQNVLICHGTVDETASEFGLSVSECQDILDECCKILYKERQKRPRPHLDDKMLSAWNGMMMAASARAGSVLNDESYVKRAEENAEFIRTHLWKDGVLLRAAYKGDGDEISLGSEINGFSDDYAWLIRGLIHLYNATLNEDWLKWAEEVQDKQNELFWDADGGAGYFMGCKDDQNILLRLKEDHDGAEPSVNSVSAGNLVRLSRLVHRLDLEEKVADIFKLFTDRLNKVPVSLPEMTTSLMLYRNPAEQIILAGDKDSKSMKEMLNAVHSSSLNPNRTILLAHTKQEGSLLYARHESLKNYIPKEATPVSAYACKDFVCSLPVNTPQQLKEQLAGSSQASTSQ